MILADKEYALSEQQILFYQQNGYLSVEGVFSPNEAALFRKEAHDLVNRLMKNNAAGVRNEGWASGACRRYRVKRAAALSPSLQSSPQLGDRHPLDGLGFVRRPHGADLAAGRDVDGRAFDIGTVADELDDDLAEVVAGRHAATGRRATLQWEKSLSIAWTR